MSDTTESTALALIPPSALPTILAADGDDMLSTKVSVKVPLMLKFCAISTTSAS